MVSYILRSFVFALVLTCMSLPVFLFAQENISAADATEEISELENQPLLDSMQTPPSGVSCFDYYTFGSVQVQLTAETASTVSGTPISFSGYIVNINPYPVLDGNLFVKVFKSRGDTNDGNGPDVVDEFFVAHNVVIPAHGKVPVSFSWKVPAYAQSGEYRIATFFTTSRKFNLLGLSFTDDIVGNTVPFTVGGEQTKGVSFVKDGVTVNKNAYFFAAFPPRANATDPVPVKATLKNTTASAERVRVQWSVYQWDAQLRENVVHEFSEDITVPARGVAYSTVSVTNTEYPVYLVRAETKWKDTKSIIGVRFVREGVDRVRINFPGVLSYPLVAGQENTLFSCLHNSGESALVSDSSLELTITDMVGEPIHTYTYNGDVSGAMMGVADTFVPEKSYDRFMLDARLYQDGEFVDEAHLVYDCDKIAPGSCVAQEKDSLGAYFSLDHTATKNILLGLGVLGVVLIIGLVVASVRPKKEEQVIV